MESNFFHDRMIEKFLLGELQGDDLKNFEIQLRDNNDLKIKFEQTKEENKTFFEYYPTDSAVGKIVAGIETGRSGHKEEEGAGWRVKTVCKFAFSGLFLAVILIGIHQLSNQNFPGELDGLTETGIERSKGSDNLDVLVSHLVALRKSNAHMDFLKDGDYAKPGDIVQLAYLSVDAPHGIILSVDGNGVVTLHFPDKKEGSTSLEIGKRSRLSTAYKLDNAPDFERFFFLTSSEEIDVHKVIDRVENMAGKNLPVIKRGELKLDSKLNQFSFLILKGEKDEE